MNNELNSYLTVALQRLEKAFQEIMKAKPYGQDLEKIKILEEMVKEQVKNENSRTAAR